MIIVFVVLIVALAIIFPIFLTVSVFFDADSKRLNFIISLFGKINLVGGYIVMNGKDIVFHISETKAVIIDLAKYKPSGNLKFFKQTIIINNYNRFFLSKTEQSFLALTVYNVFLSSVIPILRCYDLLLKTKNDFIVGKRNKFALFSTTTFCFNLVCIIIFLINKVWGK